MSMTPDQALFVVQAITQVAWAIMALAAAVLTVTGAVIVWTVVEYKAWRSDQNKVE